MATRMTGRAGALALLTISGPARAQMHHPHAAPADTVRAHIAVAEREAGFQDDHALNTAEWIVYDALYAYCQQMVRQGRLEGAVS